MQPLSVVIITYNEARDIGRCLDSVAPVADEVVVVDAFSTDATEAICRSRGATVMQRAWEGYSAAKNFGNRQARHDLVLSIDADEALSSELAGSIAAMKGRGGAGAFKFRRLTNYCGKWIRHGGWYPDVKVRIFNRTGTAWIGRIHESLAGIEEKNAEMLEGDCYHYTYYSVEEHLRQMDRFTDLMAEDLRDRGKRGSMAKLLLSPAAKFIRDYLFRAGFLDGRSGLTISALSAYATYLKYAKLRSLRSGSLGPKDSA